jgi:hypothetical protein
MKLINLLKKAQKEAEKQVCKGEDQIYSEFWDDPMNKLKFEEKIDRLHYLSTVLEDMIDEIKEEEVSLMVFHIS